MDAFLASGPMQRAVDLFCYACLVFDVAWLECLLAGWMH